MEVDCGISEALVRHYRDFCLYAGIERDEVTKDKFTKIAEKIGSIEVSTIAANGIASFFTLFSLI